MPLLDVDRIQAASSEVVRDINRRIVLNQIRNQPISRADVARVSGLQHNLSAAHQIPAALLLHPGGREFCPWLAGLSGRGQHRAVPGIRWGRDKSRGRGALERFS
jgi:hypothetical protein